MKFHLPPFRILACLTLASLPGVGVNQAADKEVAKDVMKKHHKGDDAFVKKVSKGEASNEEVKKLLADYQLMAKQTPSKGDAASWKEKTSALVAATEKLSKNAKDPDAVAGFKKAVNCKACHEVHRPN